MDDYGNDPETQEWMNAPMGKYRTDTGIYCNEPEECERLRVEVGRLRTTSRCAWCGATIAGITPEHLGALALDHLLTCADHPLRQLEKRIAELTAEAERLREALAWYADEDNWEPIIEHRRGFIGYGPSNVATDYDVESPSAAAADYGDRARAALAGEGE